jgi:hypothetical protein
MSMADGLLQLNQFEDGDEDDVENHDADNLELNT